MNKPKPPSDTDMPATIDFSQGVRGKFYKPNAVFRLPDEPDQHCQPATPTPETIDVSAKALASKPSGR